MGCLLQTLLDHPEFSEGVYWHKRDYSANEAVFREGDEGRDVYIILNGNVRILGSVDVGDAKRIQPGFGELGAGEVFGEVALFDSHARSATVQALDALTLAVLDGDKLLSFLDTHPDVGYPVLKELIETLVVRLRKTNQRMFSLFAWGLKSKGIGEHL